MIDLAGKTAVVFGLANKRSIAWGIAQKLHEAGATLAICYQNDRMKLEAQSLIDELSGASGFQCDVSNDQEIEPLFAALKDKYGKLDILVHAVAFAPASELRGEFIDTSREGFRIAHDVSVYSLIAVTRVNAISAGPIKTLAARGVGDLGDMLKSHADRAPLGRNVDQLEVGGAALFLASDLSSAITGEIMYVDCGYNIMGF